MNRRTAITAAGSVALVVAAASAAIGANVGILRTANESDGVGKLNPAVQSVPQTAPADPQVETVYVDEVVRVPGAGAVAVADAATESSTSTSAPSDDSRGSSPAVTNPDDAPGVDDDGVEHEDDDHEDEHEGAEDDD